MLLKAAPSTYNTYIEPFAGSAVPFLGFNPQTAVLADINTDVIQAYRQLKTSHRKLWWIISSLPITEEFYYELRSVQPDQLSPIERAARFIYLNRYCFNGVYRTNLKGEFNVSRGKGALGIPSLELFKGFSDRLKNTKLVNRDFETVIDSSRKNDFIYIDPPYIDSSKRDRGEYGLNSFKGRDLDRLISSLQRADSRGVSVMISYRDCPILQSQLSTWHQKSITVRRSVAQKTENRKPAEELLVTNY